MADRSINELIDSLGTDVPITKRADDHARMRDALREAREVLEEHFTSTDIVARGYRIKALLKKWDEHG